MKKTPSKTSPEMREEYNFSGGVRGKYASAYAKGSNLIVLDRKESEDPRSVDELLRSAITQNRLIQLSYYNKPRIVEPHDYGIHKGIVKLLAYQVGGASSGPLPNWRWMQVELISDVRILDRTFRGGRPAPSGKHHQWDQLFLRAKGAGQD